MLSTTPFQRVTSRLRKDPNSAVDEVPDGMTHVLMLREGVVVARGPIARTLTAETLSECFAMDLRLERRDDGRWTAWASRP